jgi:N-acetylmuramoyl-L-alanine amidase
MPGRKKPKSARSASAPSSASIPAVSAQLAKPPSLSAPVASSSTAGDQIVALARTHIGEKYHSMVVPKDNANCTGPWDCAEFASWFVYQVTGRLYGCNHDIGNPSTADAYTGAWRDDAERFGTLISINDAAGTPGAAVLRYPLQAGGEGHIVISDGKGGTVEAHSPADGVVSLKLNGRRWDTGVLVPGVAYPLASPVSVIPPNVQIYRLTTPVMEGPKVTAIQNALKQAGFGSGTIDGTFGPQTSAAVLAFQLSNQLQPDGEVGPETAAKLGVTL